jgi:hypothetical protein
VPFAPVVDALDPYLGTLDPGRLKLPEGGHRDELGAIVVGPALESLRAMLAEPTFDYVSLDADKTAYPDYYEEDRLAPPPGRAAPDRQRAPSLSRRGLGGRIRGFPR